MHPRSKLSQAQRERAVDLFEEGYGSRAVAGWFRTRPRLNEKTRSNVTNKVSDIPTGKSSTTQ